MKKTILFGALLSMTQAFGNTTQAIQDDILNESNEVLKCETAIAPAPVAIAAPVDEIETNKELSPSQKLKAYRAKLEEKNLVLLEKKLELIRLEQEMALLRNLERSMNKTLSAIKDL